MADDIDLTQGLAALLAEAENPARGALKALPVTPTMGSADPSNFREGTLLGLLGRYSPSGLISRHTPETREGAQLQRRLGGLADDAALFMVPEIARGLYGGYQGAKSMIAAANEVPKGPWNSRMLDEMLDARGSLPARHELNVPEAPGSRPLVPRSPKDLNAEYDALVNEARNFMQPRMVPNEEGRGMLNPLDGSIYGYAERPAPGRWSYTASEKRPLRNGRGAEDWVDLVREQGANNQNIPGVAEQAEALARRLEGIKGQQAPYREANIRDVDNIDAVTGTRYINGKDPFHPEFEGSYNRYLEDVRKFFNGKHGDDIPYAFGQFDELKNILQREFGANLQDRGDVRRAYRDFWDAEAKLRAAGKMTRHEQAASAQKQLSDQWVREHLGVDPDKTDPDVVRAMGQAYFKPMMDRTRALAERAERRMRGLPDPEANPAMRAIASNMMRYGPPTAVGAYGAAKGLDLASMLMERERARRDVLSPPDPNRP